MAAVRRLVRPGAASAGGDPAAQLVYPDMPLIIGTDEENSAPGIPQPVIVTGGESLPPSFPLGSAGTWLPPPLVGDGGNVPFPTPVVPPGTGAGQNQPQFGSGSALLPTPASLFPDYSAPGPFQPIVLTNLMQIGPGPPPFTPGSQPVTISTAPNIPQLPWVPFPPPAPVNTVRPSITIMTDLEVGSQVAGQTGTWTGAAPITYARQWLRDETPIVGQTAAGYTFVTADIGAMIGMTVIASNAGGSTEIDAIAVGPVIPIEEPPPLDDAEPVARTTAHRTPAKSKKRR